MFVLAFLFLSFMIARAYESGVHREIYREFKGLSRVGKWLAIIFLITCVSDAGSKGISPVTRMMRFLLWNIGDPWELVTASRNAESADASARAATNDLAVAAQSTNSAVYTLSFDWSASRRLPYHASQNIMAYTAWVAPTNIAGTLYEDHYVAFNAVASTNPAVIYIEYARKTDAGIERYTSAVVTSSYPNVSVVNLQSGAHTCYWFRCAVPAAFTNAVRDWSGEALFGAPADSGKGFDLL
jgi:hypothetical protein